MKYQLVILLMIIAPSFTSQSQNKTPFTNLDVFDLEWADDPQISPDGELIVYARGSMDIMKDRRTTSLWMIDATGSNHMKLTDRETRESQATWSPDGQRLAFVSSTDEGSEIYMYWRSSGKIGKLTQLEKSPRGLSWSADGKWIAFTMFVEQKAPSLVNPPAKPQGAEWAPHPRVETRLKHEADGSGYMDPGFTHVFVISAEGGSARQITSGDYNHRGSLAWSKDAENIYTSGNRSDNWEYEWRNSEIYSVNVSTGSTNSLTERNGPDGGLALSPNGKMIAYLGFDDKMQTYQVTRLYTMNADGSDKKEINTKLDRSIRDIQWASNGEGIYFLYDDKGNSKLAHTTLSGKVTKVADNLGGTGVARPYAGGGDYSISKNGKIALNITTPDYPAELAITSKGGDITELTSLNDDLLPYRTLGKTEEVWYKSSFDNRDIQGWITTPPNYDSSKKYPLLVENHGGPISNYGDIFSPEVQLYAADGYVVFYPNPRGSTSYGEEFGNLLYHNYPGEDYVDVMDGVDYLVERGIVSEDSLFVTGGSAGGIMTAWIIGKNNRFRSAAVVKPVMNWISKTLVADNYFGYANTRFPGQPWTNFEDYWNFSPISLVGNVETPTLVMVGTEDLRTPLSEAKQLYHALKIRKIETALVEVWGSYHFIANRPSQLITKVDHILAWFEKYRK
ncbi:MAG: S9 family peptidase [Cyclobacteriaceae bacterium]